MHTQMLNYRIIIEPEKQGKKIAYNVYCDTLGLADWGYSVEEAIKNIKSLIKFHIECLLEDGSEVPSENTDKELIMLTRVSIQRAGTDSQVVVA